MGDFNGHHTLWEVNIKGKQLEDLILKSHLIIFNEKIFNEKSSTYFHSESGSFTSINITLGSSSIFLDFYCNVGPNPCGSDHFSIILESGGPPENCSEMEADEANLGTISASMQHSSALICYYRW